MRRRAPDDEPSALPFDLPGLSVLEAARALVERSALCWFEIDILERRAAGEQVGPPEISVEAAAGLLARWRGPIPGLRLIELAHWSSPAKVRRGVVFDRARRERPDDGNPFVKE